MIYLVYVLSFPSAASGSGCFHVRTAKTLPMANISVNLNFFYSREKYLNRYRYPDMRGYSVYHHYATSKIGITYGIIDYIEAFLGTTVYGKYDEQTEVGEDIPTNDLYLVGDKNFYGGLKFWVPLINTPELLVKWNIGGEISGKRSVFDIQDEDTMFIREFSPTFPTWGVLEGRLLTDVEIGPLLIHLSGGYRRNFDNKGLSFPANMEAIQSLPPDVQLRLIEYWSSFYDPPYTNALVWGVATEILLGPYASFILEGSGVYLPYRFLDMAPANYPAGADTSIGTVGIRFITPVGVTFDFSVDWLFTHKDFVGDWYFTGVHTLPRETEWEYIPSGTEVENYYNVLGRWRYHFGITTTNPLIPEPEEPPKGEIAVSVRDAHTDLPLVAQVTVEKEGEVIEALPTDEAGNLLLSLAPGIYKISISKEGYITRKFTVTVKKGASVNLPVSLKKKTIPTGIVAVKVTDSKTGNPVMANITFSDPEISPITTDVNGEANIKLKPGSYELTITAEGYHPKTVPVSVKQGASIPLPVVLEPATTAKGIFTGTVTDVRTGKPVGAKITFLGTNLKPIVSDLETGIFKVELPPGTYQVKVEADGYQPKAIPVVIKEGETTIQYIKLAEKLTKKKRIVLQGINFDPGKAVIKPMYYPILDRVAEVLKENPNVKVEIQGHTDSVGPEDYNLRLSQARAEAVRQYLISKGISPDRLIAKGYGEMMPIADNRTREGRAKNRRIEFVVIEE